MWYSIKTRDETVRLWSTGCVFFFTGQVVILPSFTPTPTPFPVLSTSHRSLLPWSLSLSLFFLSFPLCQPPQSLSHCLSLTFSFSSISFSLSGVSFDHLPVLTNSPWPEGWNSITQELAASTALVIGKVHWCNVDIIPYDWFGPGSLNGLLWSVSLVSGGKGQKILKPEIYTFFPEWSVWWESLCER